MAAKQRIVCFGPGPAFKGGLANYNASLALALDRSGEAEVHLVSWTQQYPSIVPREFKDTRSKGSMLDGSGVTMHYLTDYNRPSTWKETARLIASLEPDQVIFQWSIAIQGLPIGRIMAGIKKRCRARIVADLHFVIQKEGSLIDKPLTRSGLRHADAYITHSLKTLDELRSLFPGLRFSLLGEPGARTVLALYHPVYDMFRPDPAFDREAFHREHGLREHVFLFFGFIRKYKGLHHAIRAFAEIAKERDDVSLLICGESFWNTLDDRKWTTRVKKVLFGAAKAVLLRRQDDEKDYRPLELIDVLGLRDRVAVFNDFVPNEEVHKYFQASDAVVLYYEYATPSGIESMAYNFGLPILATEVGHFPEVIREGENGYLAKAEDITSMADAMRKFLAHPVPSERVKKFAENLSWKGYAEAILRSLKR